MIATAMKLTCLFNCVTIACYVKKIVCCHKNQNKSKQKLFVLSLYSAINFKQKSIVLSSYST